MDAPDNTPIFEWLGGIVAAGLITWVGWLHNTISGLYAKLALGETRTATLEERISGVATAQVTMNTALTDRLTRIEDKLDRILEK